MPAHRGQPARQRRLADQAHRHRHQGRRHHHPAPASSRRARRSAGQRHLRPPPDRRLGRHQRSISATIAAPEKPTSPCRHGMGQLDHRSTWRMGRIPLIKASRAYHPQAWPRPLLRHRSGLDPQRCVHPVASEWGGLAGATRSGRLGLDDPGQVAQLGHGRDGQACRRNGRLGCGRPATSCVAAQLLGAAAEVRCHHQAVQLEELGAGGRALVYRRPMRRLR